MIPDEFYIYINWSPFYSKAFECTFFSSKHVTYSWIGHMLGQKISLSKFRKFSSVQFSHSVVSDSMQTHELQHARPPCPSPTPRDYPNSCPLSRWCHPTISSSVIPFSSCPQSFPASGSFPMSQLLAWGVLEFQLQHQFFQGTPRTDLL